MKETLINLRKVYQYGKQYKKKLVMQIIAVICGIVTGVILPLAVAKQIVYFTSSDWQQLVIMSIVVLIINSVRSFVAFFFTRKNSQVFRKFVMKNLQIDLGREILKISQKDMDTNSSGIFIQRVTCDTEKMSDFFHNSLMDIMRLLTNIGALFATFVINRQVFLYYLFVSIVLTSLHLEKTKKYGKVFKLYKKETDGVSSLIGELIHGVRDIKMLNSKDSFMNKLDENIESQNQKRFEMSNINAKYTYIIEILTYVFELGLVVLLIYLINSNIISVAIAIALFNYKSGIMTTVMATISDLMNLSKEFNVSCNRVFEILDNSRFEKEKFGNKHIENINGNFEFRNVSFEYVDGNKVLDNLNFKINSGQMIGFVGKSGAGKTTIFNLLCKMYSLKSGKIFIDGYDINELDEDSIRGNITIISQNPYIFNLSIRDNFKLVKSNLTNDEMISACKSACIDDFINTLPNKYDTVVGEGGVILSGGQKQRIAIARALIQKTKIILFDEATSALDNETQAEIQKAISNLKDEYTILVIAHRLSTIVNCDEIMILENGRINDKGTHNELLNRNDIYQKLYQTEILK